MGLTSAALGGVCASILALSSSLIRLVDGRLCAILFTEESSNLIDRERERRLAKRGLLFLRV